MTIEIPKDVHREAVASLQRYFAENMEDQIGNLQASALLGFFLEEIAPVVYNQAVSDVQARIQARVMDVDVEVHKDAF